MNRKSVEADIAKVLGNERFAVLWWDLQLPGLGKRTPNEVWAEDPEKIVEYIASYKE